MYPYVRLGLELLRYRNAPPLPVGGVHVSHLSCLPGDIDPWRELNNGRTLTLYDLGRLPLIARTGIARAVKANGWGLTVAGSSVRYRRRVRLFHRVEMRSALIGVDARFLYVQQAMFRAGEALSSVLIRTAVTSPVGIVAPARLLAALGDPSDVPALPGWAAAWGEADALRPWPPEF